MICFEKENHTYTDEFQRVFTSVSNVVSNYKNPFRKEFWSKYKAIQQIMTPYDFDKLRDKCMKEGFTDDLIERMMKHVDEQKVKKAQQKILQEWEKKKEEGMSRGNVYHDHMEKKAGREKEIENPLTEKTYTVQSTAKKTDACDNVSLEENLYDLEDGYYAELLVFHEPYQLAGQSDGVFIETIDGVRYVDISDYKTNKKIRKTSHYVRRKKDYKRMKPPLHRMMDCNYVHYQLQLSTYMWMMEQFGFTPRNLWIKHHNEILELRYASREVENMLNDYFYFSQMDI